MAPQTAAKRGRVVDLDYRYYVGLDIGDGESCLAWHDTRCSTTTAKVYERPSTGETSIVTAMAHDPTTGLTLIGEAAVMSAEAVQFSVNFKEPPTPGSLRTPPAVLFAEVLLDELFAQHPEMRTDCVVHVGYPSGWDDDSVTAYRSHLDKLGVPLHLVAESHSALIHVADDVAAAGREATVRDRTLVIDLGSSTTDLTFVDDFVPANLDLGADFGCRLIDFELRDLVTVAFDADDDFQAAIRLPSGRQLLTLACRRAKEAHFSGTEGHVRNVPGAGDPRLGKILDRAARWLRQCDVRRLVKRPGGWADRYSSLLVEAQDQLGVTPEAIVLTGGGSRMALVHELTAAAFPDATLRSDNQPSFSVARGLASNARHRGRIISFQRDIHETVAGDRFRSSVRDELATHLEDLTFEAVRSMRQVLEPTQTGSPAADTAVAGAAIGQLTDIARSIEQALSPLVLDVCRSYEVPDDRLRIDVTLPDSVLARAVRTVVDQVGQRPPVPQPTFREHTWLIRPGTRRAGKLFERTRARGYNDDVVVLVASMAVDLGIAGIRSLWAWRASLRPVGGSSVVAVNGRVDLTTAELDAMAAEIVTTIAEEMTQRAQAVERYLG